MTAPGIVRSKTLHRTFFFLVLFSAGFLFGCVTLPPEQKDSLDLESELDRNRLLEEGFGVDRILPGVIRVADRNWTLLVVDSDSYGVSEWVVFADRSSSVEEIAAAVPGEILFSTSPWRWEEGRKVPADGEPRWVLTWNRVEPTGTGTFGMAPYGGTGEMHRAEENSDSSPTLVHSAFYPLLRDGEIVAGEFPLPRLRAARVTLGWSADQEEIYLLAMDGRLPLSQPGATTEDAAAILRRFGASDAINLDGGRSGFVFIRSVGVSGVAEFPEFGEIHPRILGKRDVGPRGIALSWYNSVP